MANDQNWGQRNSGLIGAGVGVATGLLGMIGQRRREERAMRNQQKLMGIQMHNQMKLNQQGHDLQMQAWKDTNYPAQMQMIKEAGLNPGLLYGMGGAGGATTGSQAGGSAQGGNAPAPQPMELANILQASLTKAQIDNINADTKKKNKETEGVGQGIEESKTRMDKIIAETSNEKLKGRLISLQSDMQEIDNAYRPHVLDAEIKQIGEQTKQLALDNEITKDAYDSIVDELKQKAVGQRIMNTLNQENIKLAKEKQNEIRNSIAQKWQEIGQGAVRLGQENVRLNQEQARIEITKFVENLKAEYPSIGVVTGRMINEVIKTVEEVDNITFHSVWGTPKTDVKRKID